MLKIIIFLSSVVALGTGLHCFVSLCEGDHCNKPQLPYGNVTECRDNGHASDVACTTMVMKDYGQIRVVRGCGLDPKKKFNGVICPYDASCDYCYTDLCNSAPPTNMNVVTIISTIFLVALPLCKF
ncbi:uncharacterized protein LOC114328045 [Diabrotica virgifera virgifera]|uniref:Uncharacterized protein LOC114328045 n=1 Tax=Diabrotica virgifera virgifera TaxID=50390 RepID=A0A6P7FHA3_DIAVI|nr:uncharacterized protein LOC114328045 [Diabrotica virgifera virgifera]